MKLTKERITEFRCQLKALTKEELIEVLIARQFALEMAAADTSPLYAIWEWYVTDIYEQMRKL